MADAHRPLPGLGTEQTDTPTAFLKSDHVIEQGITIDNSARDALNTPTTTLRPGLALGKITATGKFKEYDNSAVDGSEVCVGYLKHQEKVLDSDGNASDADGVIVIHAYVDKSALIGNDAGAELDCAGRIIYDSDILLEI